MTLKDYAALVEAKLNALLPEAEKNTPGMDDMPWLLQNAMRYSLMAGGKRLRPAMLLACADMLGVSREEAMIPACALEAVNPAAVLNRGYAVIRRGGEAISSAAALNQNDLIDIRMRDGGATARVLDTDREIE